MTRADLWLAALVEFYQALIERAQFAHNPKIYQKDAFSDVLHDESFQGSWLQWFLRETESMHGEFMCTMLLKRNSIIDDTLPAARVRRYESPDEHPFTPRDQLPKPLLPALDYPSLLHPHGINVNDAILAFYSHDIVPAITRHCANEDDQNYGSAATRDLEVLQNMSRRIHYGMFVSESKFRECPADFVPHILNPNPEKLLALITKPAVEAALLVRLAKKAQLYGSELDSKGELIPAKSKIDTEEIVRLYKDRIIPLTKEVEVRLIETK